MHWGAEGGGERERENRCEPQFFFSADTGVYQDSVTVSYRSGPGEGDGAAVAPPLLRCLPVLLVHAFEHLLDVADLVLAHGRHVHVAPGEPAAATDKSVMS